MPLPDETTQTLRRNAFSIFEVLCLLDNGERTQFLQLENLHKAYTVELIERPRVLTNYDEPFRKVRLSSPLPTRDLHASGCTQITLVHSILSSYSNYNTTSSTCSSKRSPGAPLFYLPSRHPCCLLLVQVIHIPALDGGRSHPYTAHQTHYWGD